MRGRTWSAVALLLVPLLAGCMTGPSSTEDALGTGEGDPLWFGAVRDPAQAVEVIQRLGAIDGVQVAEIGRSMEGRPIHTVTLGEGPFVLWVMGRLHGNEPTGMEAILLLMELLADPDTRLPDEAPAILHDFAAHRELLLERLTFVFVPVGNPDGAEAYTRGNSLGVDLNRDFFAFSQVESQIIRDAFWAHRPDGCLDLHNIGPSENDFEAYGPEGPLLDPVLDALMVKDSWLAVHEIDAQGGRASGFNEDYRAPEPLEEHPWPEVYHPGTHDFFCTARGAPGWTPEGSIPSGGNGATDPEFAWSARLHAVTVATSAFHWSGVYDGVVPEVTTRETTVTSQPGTGFGWRGPQEEGTDVLFQAVWRAVAGYGDHSLTPVRLVVTDPVGTVHEARLPGPYQWSASVLIENAPMGEYSVSVQSLVPIELQTRYQVWPKGAPLVEVQRVDDGLKILADSEAQQTMTVHLSDVAAYGAWNEAVFSMEPVAVFDLNGAVDDRSVAKWVFTLEPGEEVVVAFDGVADDAPGPWRFTAQSGDRLHMGHDTKPRVAHG